MKIPRARKSPSILKVFKAVKVFKSLTSLEAQRRLFERKAKLGETVVVAVENGMPVTISGEEALRRFYAKHPVQ